MVVRFERRRPAASMVDKQLIFTRWRANREAVRLLICSENVTTNHPNRRTCISIRGGAEAVAAGQRGLGAVPGESMAMIARMESSMSADARAETTYISNDRSCRGQGRFVRHVRRASRPTEIISLAAVQSVRFVNDSSEGRRPERGVDVATRQHYTAGESHGGGPMTTRKSRSSGVGPATPQLEARPNPANGFSPTARREANVFMYPSCCGCSHQTFHIRTSVALHRCAAITLPPHIFQTTFLPCRDVLRSRPSQCGARW